MAFWNISTSIATPCPKHKFNGSIKLRIITGKSSNSAIPMSRAINSCLGRRMQQQKYKPHLHYKLGELHCVPKCRGSHHSLLKIGEKHDEDF